MKEPKKNHGLDNLNGKELDDFLKEDLRVFKKHIENGAKKLVGTRTKEKVRGCFHCKIWAKTDRFIDEILKG